MKDTGWKIQDVDKSYRMKETGWKIQDKWYKMKDTGWKK